MAQTRRSFLNSTLALLLAWVSGHARPRMQAETTDSGESLAQAMDRETAGIRPTESDKLHLEAPDIAEDGALVPVTVESDLPNVDSIWVFVEKNPNPLAARFEINNSLDPFVSLRVKMNESCDVIAVAKSGGEYFSTRKKVRVLVGGCG